MGMQTLRRESDFRDLFNRLAAVTAQDSARWGRMTVYQMTRHLADASRATCGLQSLITMEHIMQRAIVLRFVSFFLIFAAATIAIAGAFLSGFLSARAMAVAYIILSLAGVCALTVGIANAKRSVGVSTEHTGNGQAKTKRSAWALGCLVVVSVGMLAYGVLTSSGAPLLSQIFGIGVGISVSVGLIFALMKQRRKLEK